MENVAAMTNASSGCMPGPPLSFSSARLSGYFPFTFRSKSISYRASVIVTPVADPGPFISYRIVPNMSKKSSTPPTLDLGKTSLDNARSETSPRSPKSLAVSPSKSAMSSPSSPGFKGATIRPLTGQSVQPSERSLVAPKNTEPSSHQVDGALPPPTPGITAIPPFPPSPKESATSKHQREASKSFFSSFKSSKSSHRTLPSDVSSSQISEKPVSRGSSKDRSVYRYARSHNTSSPDLPSTSENGDIKEEVNSSNASPRDAKFNENGKGQKLSTKKSKPRFANLLTRTRSIRHDEQSLPSRPSTARRPSNGLMKLEEHSDSQSQEALRTAPLQNERAFREAMDSSIRNRSVDRPPTNDGSNYLKKERSYGGSGLPTSLTSSSLFNNIKQTSSGATKTLGRAGKGFLGKFRGNNSSEQNTITDDNYVCKVINLPLIEQCRKTRISKRLQDSKDKTEYWMPALPWRCIEYVYPMCWPIVRC